MNHGFIRLAAASPDLRVADCDYNGRAILSTLRQASDVGVELLVLPELCVTGYTCGDLFLQRRLQADALTALETIARESADLPLLFLVGMPVPLGNGIYNCAAILHRGKIVALIPKTYIPNYGEFYERRHFTPAPADSAASGVTVFLSPAFPSVPFGTDILVSDSRRPDIALAAEICEDLWVPEPPSARHALAGALIMANLSASNEVIGKAEYRRMLAASQSGRLAAAYVYAGAGAGESTTDMVFAGHSLIAEN
ncbi:MAG: NAD(+) synthase, partial [Spirochaetaceae bacterium]|nr:NAD(+) synthase [Spirochaetaceae bacterium]